MKLLYVLCAVLIFSFATSSYAEEEDILPLQDNNPPPIVIKDSNTRAIVENISNHKIIKAFSYNRDWFIGEVVLAESQDKDIGIVAFFEVKSIVENKNGYVELTCELLRHSRLSLVQVGDQLLHIDLSSKNTNYNGSTDLMVQKSSPLVSSKYKPLITQGLTVGETAETLWKGENLMTWYGQVYYGLSDQMTLETIIPANLLGAYNASVKFRIRQSKSSVLSMGPNFVRIPSENKATLNINFFWDSISSQTTISHTFLTLALFSFDEAADIAAIKSIGTSSIQTGYELILSNWDRVLLGPTYNFEKKAVGGYLTYLKIWDRFHGGISLNSTNISSLKISPVDGYYFSFDAYWRF